MLTSKQQNDSFCYNFFLSHGYDSRIPFPDVVHVLSQAGPSEFHSFHLLHKLIQVDSAFLSLCFLSHIFRFLIHSSRFGLMECLLVRNINLTTSGFTKSIHHLSKSCPSLFPLFG